MVVPYQRLLFIALFGVAGVFARYLTGLWAQRAWGTAFPFGTLAVNLLGSFVIGAIYVVASEARLISDDLRLGVMVGFLGGFTTFSSYSIESLHLMEQGRLGHSLLYFVGSPLLGLLACLGGVWAGRFAGRLVGLMGIGP
jgi:CrcB protein